MAEQKPLITQEWILDKINACMKDTGTNRDEATKLVSEELFQCENVLEDPGFDKLPHRNT